jgi:DhnA family fructose-bisphosphate aldolase class Ia
LADHPARGSIAVGDEPFAMADRHDLLARLVSILQSQWVDGVLAGMDLLEELMMLHGMMKPEGKGFLDEKVLIASLNRAGIPGSAWELNDPVSGTDFETCRAYGIDAVKMLWRVDLGSDDSLKTMMGCANSITRMNQGDLPFILEPLPVTRQGNSYRVVKEPDPFIRLLGIASALGNSSRNLWLKIPYTPDFPRVIRSTTLPIVILGGDRTDLEKTLEELHHALQAGHQVRGACFGRNVLYPQSKTPEEVANSIGRLIHKPTASMRTHE